MVCLHDMHTHAHDIKSFRISGKLILFQLSDPNNATPTIPRFGTTYNSISIFVPHTKSMHAPTLVSKASTKFLE